MSAAGPGCVSRLLALLLLGLLVWAAWTYGPDLRDRIRSGDSEPEAATEPSPELAAAAVDRYQQILEGEREEASFSELELESIFRYRLPDYLPPGAVNPTIRLRDGEVLLGVGVGVEMVPDIPELEGLREILPDTVPVRLEGLLLTLEGGDAVFVVRRIVAAGVPLPRRLHGRILAALDPRDREGLPPGSLEVPLPPGIRAAYIDGDELVLVGRP